MKVDLGIWEWLNKLFVVLLAGAAVVGVVVWYLPLIKNHESARLRLYEEQRQLAQLLATSNTLSRGIEEFNRRENIERLARELGLARTNEYVLQMIPATNAAPAVAPTRP